MLVHKALNSITKKNYNYVPHMPDETTPQEMLYRLALCFLGDAKVRGLIERASNTFRATKPFYFVIDI